MAISAAPDSSFTPQATSTQSSSTPPAAAPSSTPAPVSPAPADTTQVSQEASQPAGSNPINFQSWADDTADGQAAELAGGTSPDLENSGQLQQQWPAQTNVITSVREGQLANGNFTPTLINAINQQAPGDSLGSAAQKLSATPGSGLGDGSDQTLPAPVGQQVVHFKDNENPVYAPGTSDADAWRKNAPGQQPPPRYLLEIGGEPQPSDPNSSEPSQAQQIDQNLHDVEGAVRQNYGNDAAQNGANANDPGSQSNLQVDTLRQPTDDQLQTAMQKARDFAAANPGAQMLIYYKGHGGLAGSPGQADLQPGATGADQQNGLQGASEGTLYTNLPPAGPPGTMPAPGRQPLTEDRLKALVNQNLSGYKSIDLLIDACQSGAFAS